MEEHVHNKVSSSLLPPALCVRCSRADGEGEKEETEAETRERGRQLKLSMKRGAEDDCTRQQGVYSAAGLLAVG